MRTGDGEVYAGHVPIRDRNTLKERLNTQVHCTAVWDD